MQESGVWICEDWIGLLAVRALLGPGLGDYRCREGKEGLPGLGFPLAPTLPLGGGLSLSKGLGQHPSLEIHARA